MFCSWPCICPAICPCNCPAICPAIWPGIICPGTWPCIWPASWPICCMCWGNWPICICPICCGIIWPPMGFGEGLGRDGDCAAAAAAAANWALKFGGKAFGCMNCCGAPPCSDGMGDACGNCCAAGEKGWGEVEATLCGTLPGRIWLAMMGDGVAFAEPFGWRWGYGEGWPGGGCDMPAC